MSEVFKSTTEEASEALLVVEISYPAQAQTERFPLNHDLRTNGILSNETTAKQLTADENRRATKIDQAIEGLESGAFGSLRDVSLSLQHSPCWLSELKNRRPDVAERVDKALQSPKFKEAQKAKNKSRGRKDRNIEQVHQAIEGLKSGQYKNLTQASRAAGFNKTWLSELKNRRPDIAELIDEAFQSPAFKEAQNAKNKSQHRKERSMQSINQAIEGLKSGQYKNLSQASQALGFNRNWLSRLKKKDPAVAELIDEAFQLPAFKEAQNAKNKSRWHRDESMQSINQAIEGLKSGQYKNLSHASRVLGFNKGWLSEMRNRKPDIAELIDEALKSAKPEVVQPKTCDKPTKTSKNSPKPRVSQSARRKKEPSKAAPAKKKAPLKTAGKPRQLKSNDGQIETSTQSQKSKNNKRPKPKQAEIKSPLAQPAKTAVQEKDARLIPPTTTITHKILEIIRFWGGDVSSEEIIADLHKAGYRRAYDDNTKQLVDSILKRKQRFMRLKNC